VSFVQVAHLYFRFKKFKILRKINFSENALFNILRMFPNILHLYIQQACTKSAKISCFQKSHDNCTGLYHSLLHQLLYLLSLCSSVWCAHVSSWNCTYYQNSVFSFLNKGWKQKRNKGFSLNKNLSVKTCHLLSLYAWLAIVQATALYTNTNLNWRSPEFRKLKGRWAHLLAEKKVRLDKYQHSIFQFVLPYFLW